MIKRTLIACAVGVLIASGVNNAQAAPTNPAAKCEQVLDRPDWGTVPYIAYRSCKVGWPHRWTNRELGALAHEVLVRLVFPYESGRMVCRARALTVGPGARCAGRVGGYRVRVNVTGIFEDGSYYARIV